MLAWFGLMSLAGIMVAGPASDLIGNKIPIALTFLLRVLLFLLILKYQNLMVSASPILLQPLSRQLSLVDSTEFPISVLFLASLQRFTT